MNKIIFIVLISAGTCWGQQADSLSEKAINQVISNLFLGMKQGDSALVRSCFVTHPTLQSVFIHPRTGKTQVVSDSLNEFLQVVGMPHEQVWNEIPLSTTIHLDGDLLATAWVPYKFLLNETYQHEGVDVFIFVKMDGSWKIATLTDTRRVKKQ